MIRPRPRAVPGTGWRPGGGAGSVMAGHSRMAARAFRQTAGVEPASPPDMRSPQPPASEPEPVLRPGREVAWREMTGCFVAYLLMAIAIIGLPLGIVVGIVTGEWRWLVPWALVAIAVVVLGRLNKIPIFGD